MQSARNRLYLTWGIACMAGYSWLFCIYVIHLKPFTVCLFKRVTSIPCPSCGSTRSALFVLNGDFISAFMTNPIGILIPLSMLVFPLWIVIDLLLKRNTLFSMYSAAEEGIKRKLVAVPLLMIVLANWYWNILKGV